MAKKIRFKIITFEKLVKIMVWIGIIFLVVGITASFPLAHWMKKENNPTIEYVLTDKSRPEPNTDDMVKYLHQKGNNLWKHADKDFRDESKTAAVKFLKENYPNYFNDNETMETAIFYGNFLYYYSDKDTPENNVGWFTDLAVSKVYTNADTVDSENTQKYLNKIGENLNNID